LPLSPTAAFRSHLAIEEKRGRRRVRASSLLFFISRSGTGLVPVPPVAKIASQALAPAAAEAGPGVTAAAAAGPVQWNGIDDSQPPASTDADGDEDMGSSSSKKLEEVQLRWAESTVQGRRQYNEGQLHRICRRALEFVFPSAFARTCLLTGRSYAALIFVCAVSRVVVLPCPPSLRPVPVSFPDRCSVFAPLSPAKKPLDQGQSFFSVLDGHGGEWCAEWVAAHLAAFVAMEPGQNCCT